MKNIINKTITMLAVLLLLASTACEEQLTEMNENPFGIPLDDGNVNLLMPTVLGPIAMNYLGLGTNEFSGAMQHTQKSGWAGSHNYFDWNGRGWESYYDALRTNKRMMINAEEAGFVFHQAVGLTMRALIFGQIADYWGDAPLTEALRGDEGEEFIQPAFDSQENIYAAVLADLQAAVNLFATGDDTGLQPSADVYFGGDMSQWQKFANSLIIRYSVRISEKNSSAAQSNVESVVSSGNFITSYEDDAYMDITGGANDQWPLQYDNETSSTRWMSCEKLIDQLSATNDPRRDVWFAPVQVKWVEDLSISGYDEDVILVDGIPEPIANWADWIDYQGVDATFTRRFNPNDTTFDTRDFIGVPAGTTQDSVHTFNGNPVGGQGRHNIHVSMLTPTFMVGDASPGDLLRASLLTASEMHFTLAEMALKGWNVGDAQTHYEEGIRNSLEVWGLGDQYDSFIQEV
jgi:hypothetical protein